MKKLIIASFSLLLTAATTQAQPKLREVTYQSREHFEQDFPDAKEVSWERTANFDEASFKQDGKSMRAFYDNKSELVGSTTTSKMEELPADAQKYIQKKYGDYKVDEVFLFDDNEFNETDMLLYGHQFEDEDNYFVGLEKNGKRVVLQVSMDGQVGEFYTKQ
jgi:hypothetical protein